MQQRPILVTGATGKTGSRIIQRLQNQGIPTRSGSRSADPAFDWNDPDGWPAVLQGCGSLYIAYQPDLAVPGAVETVERFIQLARDMGVTKFVLLSGRGEEEAQRAERMLQALDVDWTILRASWFFQNFSESFLLDAVNGGVVALPVGGVKEPFIDVDDIADAAVAALTQPGHRGKLYELTGPELLTFADAVRAVSVASKRPIRFEEVSLQQYAQGLAEIDLPEEMSSLVMYLFENVLDGRNSELANGVREALGREPNHFFSYARDTAATGVWGVAQ